MFGLNKKKFIEVTYRAAKDEKLRVYKCDPTPAKATKTHNTYRVLRREGNYVYRTLIKARIQSTKRVK